MGQGEHNIKQGKGPVQVAGLGREGHAAGGTQPQHRKLKAGLWFCSSKDMWGRHRTHR